MSRDLVTILEELGAGAFGQVHKGVYNDPEKGPMECAVKSVRDGANYEECLKFLKEADTMKYVIATLFSNVKLIRFFSS